MKFNSIEIEYNNDVKKSDIGTNYNQLKYRRITKRESDSTTSIRKKHSIGIGSGFAFVLSGDFWQDHQLFQDSYAVIAYKHLIGLKAAGSNSNFIVLKTTYFFNFFNLSPYKKSTYRWTVELGYQYKRKQSRLLEEYNDMYYLIGFGRYTYNAANPIYFINADNVLDEFTSINLNFASFKVGWQLGKNIFIDSFILYNYAENIYSKTSTGVNFYFMPSFKFRK